MQERKGTAQVESWLAGSVCGQILCLHPAPVLKLVSSLDFFDLEMVNFAFRSSKDPLLQPPDLP